MVPPWCPDGPARSRIPAYGDRVASRSRTRTCLQRALIALHDWSPKTYQPLETTVTWCLGGAWPSGLAHRGAWIGEHTISIKTESMVVVDLEMGNRPREGEPFYEPGELIDVNSMTETGIEHTSKAIVLTSNRETGWIQVVVETAIMEDDDE